MGPVAASLKLKKLNDSPYDIGIGERKICRVKKTGYICNPKRNGVIAQLVEQRTENPCVPGSIPGDTTPKRATNK